VEDKHRQHGHGPQAVDVGAVFERCHDGTDLVREGFRPSLWARKACVKAEGRGKASASTETLIGRTSLCNDPLCRSRKASRYSRQCAQIERLKRLQIRSELPAVVEHRYDSNQSVSPVNLTGSPAVVFAPLH
jgi:hypothetical protein